MFNRTITNQRSFHENCSCLRKENYLAFCHSVHAPFFFFAIAQRPTMLPPRAKYNNHFSHERLYELLKMLVTLCTMPFRPLSFSFSWIRFRGKNKLEVSVQLILRLIQVLFSLWIFKVGIDE